MAKNDALEDAINTPLHIPGMDDAPAANPIGDAEQGAANPVAWLESDAKLHLHPRDAPRRNPFDTKTPGLDHLSELAQQLRSAANAAKEMQKPAKFSDLD